MTSWERNDNMYHTAPNVVGPWTKRGLFCLKGTLTYNSQCSFVFPLVQNGDTTFIYMGDRWSFPKQEDAASQVWLPLSPKGIHLSIPNYWPVWNVKNLSTFQLASLKEQLLKENFASDKKGTQIDFVFQGSTKFGLIGESCPDGGYAQISILDSKGHVIHNSMVDFYSKVSDVGLRFITPKLKNQKYTLRVVVSGEQGVWTDKSNARFGSTGYWVKINKTVVFPSLLLGSKVN